MRLGQGQRHLVPKVTAAEPWSPGVPATRARDPVLGGHASWGSAHPPLPRRHGAPTVTPVPLEGPARPPQEALWKGRQHAGGAAQTEQGFPAAQSAHQAAVLKRLRICLQRSELKETITRGAWAAPSRSRAPDALDLQVAPHLSLLSQTAGAPCAVSEQRPRRCCSRQLPLAGPAQLCGTLPNA